jgi:hypothetical protein
MKLRLHLQALICSLVFVFGPLSGQTVEIITSTDEVWIPGVWTRVETTISGGKGMGPCRLTYRYPVGFTFRVMETGGGDMFSDNNTLYVAWSQRPSVEVITVVYEVMPERSLSGTVELTGEFLGVTGKGTRTMVRIPASRIVIGTHVEGSPVVASHVDLQPLASKETDVVSAGSGNELNVVFRIQVLTSSSRLSDQDLMRRIGMTFSEKITIISAGALFRYQVGDCITFDCAATLLGRFKAGGVSGAFIVAYRGENQITIDQARTLVK